MQKFFICKHCGNLVGMVQNAGVPMICCGEKMQELVANSVDAAAEKHVPAVTVTGNTVFVKVGDVAHPMLEEHHIAWIYLETEHGGQRKALAIGSAPEATFILENDKPLVVYEYCNLHGLWKKEL